MRGAGMPYVAPRWLPGGHAQTIWPLAIRGTLPAYRRERWDTPDGDFIDLDWVDPSVVNGSRAGAPADGAAVPTVVLFHGLEGSSHSPYARQLMHVVRARHWRGVVVHFRGCSGEPNRLPRAYHSGDSAEADWILRRLAGATPAPLFACGVSLGGNVLLKWLGEQGEGARHVLAAAAAISVPLDLAAASHTLDHGFNRLYTKNFLNTLIPRALEKSRRFPGLLDAAHLRALRTLGEYDEVVTAPLHGFRDAADYYARSSSKPLLVSVCTPTLLLNAANDPFLPGHHLPKAHQLAAAVRMEVPAGGGHVGFVAGALPGRIDWLPRRLLHWFEAFMPSRDVR